MRQICPICGGEGSIITNPCKSCGGSGQKKVRKKLALKIPQGVETGSRLRLAGKGEPGRRGGAAGDLYVVLHVREHSLFSRQGDDLYCEVPVSEDIAALGGSVEIPTVDGPAKLKLAAGTENGKIFRLRGKGVPNIEGYGRGDLHVRVSIEVPVKLDSRQKRLFKELQEIASEENYPAQNLFHKRMAEFYDRKNAIEH